MCFHHLCSIRKLLESINAGALQLISFSLFVFYSGHTLPLTKAHLHYFHSLLFFLLCHSNEIHLYSHNFSKHPKIVFFYNKSYFIINRINAPCCVSRSTLFITVSTQQPDTSAQLDKHCGWCHSTSVDLLKYPIQ